ncbi:MAG: ABC transporter ATP-binding protein [Alphaproteobacteria bacterium]|nr:ABC transporter ATP-binding protein [Alphaproteobacteria bacterium]MDI9329946.1 ABC transporter ATP-binding protein [Alphaproteobacteria bacterium]
MSVLRIQGLDITLPKGAEREWAVRDLNLLIEAGQTLCVVGESGSGKSVMATAVMGLLAHGLRPTAGDIELHGENLLAASPYRLRELRGQAMGMVFQEPMTALNPVMSCGDQLDELLRKHTALGVTERRTQVLAMLERVKLPEPERMARSFPHQLSGGQRQRIVIAMAMLLKPALLICDEPTTALDVTTQKEILALISELQREQGSAVLFITHDMGVVAEIADMVLVMHQGLCIESGPMSLVLKQPSADYTRTLLAAVPGMQPPPARRPADGPVVLRGKGVGKTYVSRDWMGRTHPHAALTDASLALHQGETVGVVGESGSGKSTLARCLIRLIEPSAGEVHWGDAEVARLSERNLRPLRDRVQVVFQDPNRSLNPRRTVGQSLMEGAMNFGLTRQQAVVSATEMIERVKLPASALGRYPNQFSGGQRQRIALARALVCHPKVLIADEAVSALDVSVQAQILLLLRDVQQQLGLGLLFITHDLRVAAQLCDRVIVMCQGQIVEQGTTADLYAEPQHPYTRRLFASAPAGLEHL